MLPIFSSVQAAFGGWDVSFDEMPKTPTEITAWLKSHRGLRPVEPWVITFFEMLNTANGYGPADEIPHQDYRARKSLLLHSSPHPAYFHKAPCIHLQYHRVSDLPSNFVALGDTVMRVNPIWG